MASRSVLATDERIQNGKAIPRAYIAQLEEEFAQFIANLISSMDEIVHGHDTPATARVAAAKEMRMQIAEQRGILAEIERRQDQQELENKSGNLRLMVANDPRGAIDFLNAEIDKLTEFRDEMLKMATLSPLPGRDVSLKLSPPEAKVKSISSTTEDLGDDDYLFETSEDPDEPF